MVLPLCPNKTAKRRSQVWWLTPISVLWSQRIANLRLANLRLAWATWQVLTSRKKRKKQEEGKERREEGKRGERWS